LPIVQCAKKSVEDQHRITLSKRFKIQVHELGFPLFTNE
jgi:hypothetical protein